MKIIKTKTKTKTLLFVLEAPRDQHRGHEDYITENEYFGVELRPPNNLQYVCHYCWVCESRLSDQSILYHCVS